MHLCCHFFEKFNLNPSLKTDRFSPDKSMTKNLAIYWLNFGMHKFSQGLLFIFTSFPKRFQADKKFILLIIFDYVLHLYPAKGQLFDLILSRTFIVSSDNTHKETCSFLFSQVVLLGLACRIFEEGRAVLVATKFYGPS